MKFEMKNEMRLAKKTAVRIFLLCVFLFGILLIFSNLVSAVYTRTNFGASYLGGTGLGGEDFDKSLCEAGQDFIIQIAPFGCTPAVVRSDLLEEQNVPVFCQLAATQINPLIDVESIESISFSGEYPEEVSGIGFHPAKAALGVKSNLNSPVLNNIGYVVIVLKEQPNESVMPDVIEGNLTAKIKYDIENAFGVGGAKFYLPLIEDDDDWEDKYRGYGFWDAKGFLRAEDIEANRATISIYDKSLGRVSTVSLEKGETSSDIYLPGFDFCQGSLQLKLDNLEAPDTRAKLKINSDVVEIAKGEKFLDNKCQIRNLEKQGLVQKVKIYCREDERPRTFDLKIEPNITLKIDGKEREVGIGDFLYQDERNQKFVYLGYIGSKKDSAELEDLFVYLTEKPVQEERLSEGELNSVSNLVRALSAGRVTGIGLVDFTANVFKITGGLAVMAEKFIAEGKVYYELDYSVGGSVTGPNEIFGKQVEIIGFSDVQDKVLDEETQENYEAAFGNYDRVIESYSGEKYPENAIASLGEEALYNKIILAEDLEQKTTMIELCEEFRERYPESDKDLSDCNDKYKLSNTEISVRDVLIDGKIKRISFEGIYEPTFDDFGAVLVARYPNGTSKTFNLVKNELFYLNESTGEYVQLVSLDEDSAQIRMNLATGIIGQAFSSDVKRLEKDTSQTFGAGYTFTLTEINLKKSAKVSVIPKINNVGTEANFSFKIGIEKRAFQLSPEKIKEKIDSLNESIEKWENISENLGNFIEVEKTACLATGAALTIKNFIANAGGRGIARQTVMRGEDGWYERCADMVSDGKYVSQEKCLIENADEIDRDVETYYNVIEEHKKQIKDLEKDFTERRFLAESVVNTSGFMREYTEQVQGNLENLESTFTDPEGRGEAIDLNEMKETLTYNAWKEGVYDVEELREINLYMKILQDNPNDERAQKRLYSLFTDVQINSGNFVERENFAEETGMGGNSLVGSFEKLNEIRVTEYLTFGDTKYSSSEIDNSDYVFSFKDVGTGEKYLIVYDEDGSVKNTFNIGEGNSLTKLGEQNPLSIYFRKYDRTTYENPFKPGTAEVRYFETEPYKGFPAIVPFDLDEGWYVATKQTLPVGRNIATFDASGQVNSFYLCNIGTNGLEEFYSGLGDDICELINLGTGQPYNQFPGLEENEATKLVREAEEALLEASRQYSSGVSKVRIAGRSIDVGEPAANIPDIQCQDFMSPKECNLIFNLCDPVICPSSRCDFGGEYPVQDVVQSGIVGSALLCLPNIREGIYIPVCLTGIKAGIDSLNSVQKSYRDCLQSSLETGEQIGICDEIHSIYLCEFFWRQALPLAGVIIPKMTEALLGQNVRGGGEYLSVNNAWQGAEDSVNYFVQYYGANSFEAFKARSTQDAGGLFCKAFASVSYPDTGSLFDTLIEPDSPAQFHGRFDEIPFTTATVPPISQYKVFYHIFAGKDSGAYYSVYLRSGAGSSFYQDTATTRAVASGYIPVGGYASQTEDFTAPSGYKEMCINVNGQEECGFKEVSTSFVEDYVKDRYLASQATTTDIKTEQECISGSASLYNLLNPNIQEGVGGVINPEIYNQGIIRICATDNPGIGTDEDVETESSRWVEVGYCGDSKIKCWLDTESVKDVIKSAEVEGETLEEVSEDYLKILINEGGYLEEDDFEIAVDEIEDEANPQNKIELIDAIIDKVFFNHQKGYLFLLKGNVYKDLVLGIYNKIVDKETETKDSESGGTTESQTGTETETLSETSGGTTLSINEKYEQFREVFEKYSTDNLPVGWNQSDFKALLVAIGQKQTNLEDEDWLMGYGTGNENYIGADEQVRRSSAIIKAALEKRVGTGSPYEPCNSQEGENQLRCILSVYHTGKRPTGILIFGNKDGRDYASSVIEFWNNWKRFFSS